VAHRRAPAAIGPQREPQRSTGPVEESLDVEVFQGGRYFRWPGRGHPVYVFDRDKRHRDTIDVPAGTVRVEHVHDLIDEYVEENPTLTDLHR
jgi:hypothetical protein